jgi:hypothetical protein
MLCLMHRSRTHPWPARRQRALLGRLVGQRRDGVEFGPAGRRPERDKHGAMLAGRGARGTLNDDAHVCKPGLLTTERPDRPGAGTREGPHARRQPARGCCGEHGRCLRRGCGIHPRTQAERRQRIAAVVSVGDRRWVQLDNARAPACRSVFLWPMSPNWLRRSSAQKSRSWRTFLRWKPPHTRRVL